MDSLGIKATIGRTHITLTNNTENVKDDQHGKHGQNGFEPRCSWKVNSPSFLWDSCHVTDIVKWAYNLDSNRERITLRTRKKDRYKLVMFLFTPPLFHTHTKRTNK